MDTPRSPPLSDRGAGALSVARVAGAAAVVSARANAPLKLLVPRSRGDAVWAYASTLGGGLLAKDHVRLDIEVSPGAAALLTTQSTTKVYTSDDGQPARQGLSARVAAGATLAVLPDPVCAFAGAAYRQEQRIHLAHGANLALIDGFTSGRAARGERWRFRSYRSLLEVGVGDRLLVREAIALEDTPEATIADRLGRFNSIAFVVLLGPALANAAAGLLERVAAMPLPPGARGGGARRGGERGEPDGRALLAAASPIPGGAVLRVAGEDVERVAAFLRRELASVPALLGGDPWARKY